MRASVPSTVPGPSPAERRSRAALPITALPITALPIGVVPTGDLATGDLPTAPAAVGTGPVDAPPANRAARRGRAGRTAPSGSVHADRAGAARPAQGKRINPVRRSG